MVLLQKKENYILLSGHMSYRRTAKIGGKRFLVPFFSLNDLPRRQRLAGLVVDVDKDTVIMFMLTASRTVFSFDTIQAPLRCRCTSTYSDCNKWDSDSFPLSNFGSGPAKMI